MKKYRKRPEFLITAVQLRLKTEGFKYRKWGDLQSAKADDWLVDNGHNVYTIEEAAFARTYQQVSPGRYEKIAPVYATKSSKDGSIKTLEGQTHYRCGDYLVYENPEQAEGAYAIGQSEFEKMYLEIESTG